MLQPSLLRPTEHRKVFSLSNQGILSLLRQVVEEAFGKDLFFSPLLSYADFVMDVRRLEAITKMKKDLADRLSELTLQVERLGGRNGVQRELQRFSVRRASGLEYTS